MLQERSALHIIQQQWFAKSESIVEIIWAISTCSVSRATQKIEE